MKKILGIIFISLMFCNIRFADIYMKDGKHFEERLYQEDGLVIEVFCVDGYKFVATERSTTSTSGKSNAISTVQFFEYDSNRGISRPAKC